MPLRPSKNPSSPKKTVTISAPPERKHAPYGVVLMVAIVAMLVIALLLVWRELPFGKTPTPAPTPPAPVVVVPVSAEQTACETGGGKWAECGNPCHGKPGEVCIEKCEAQCLCGGADAWTCSADLICTDYEPAEGEPNAVGVCRAKPPEPPAPTGPARATPEGMICDALNYNCVYEKAKDSTLSNPFLVNGSGIAFENTINWRLLDAKGVVLEQGFTMASAPDIGQPGDFQIRGFLLSVPKTATGTLEVLEYSAKDGAPIHVVSIPVVFPRQTMTSKIYLRTIATPTETDCSLVNQLEVTVPRSGLPVETSLRLLLKMGELRPTETAIPKGTRLESLSVSGGTANVVLSSELQNFGGGSCNVQAIRAQIETTLKQSPLVKKVLISTPGKTAEETLQP